MGRHKQPTKMKVIKGTVRKDRIAKNEFKPDGITDFPEAPDYFDEDGVRIWNKVLQKCRHYISDIDLDLLEMYCYHSALAKKAAKSLKEEGELVPITNARGHSYQTKSPWFEILNKSAAMASSLSGKFGLSPSDRAKIDMPEPKEESLLEKLMRGA